MPYSEDEPDNEIIKILTEYELPEVLLDNDVFIKTYEPKDDEEIDLLMDALYIAADKRSPTGTRTPANVERLINIRNKLHDELEKRKYDEIAEEKRSENLRQNVALNAQRDHERVLLSVRNEKIEKMKRLKEALKNPRVQDLLVKIRMRQMTPQQAFEAVKSNPEWNEQMKQTTLQETRKIKGGKSRVFRRKNKKMTSTSRRKVRGTRRHRKSYSRRSTRK